MAGRYPNFSDLAAGRPIAILGLGLTGCAVAKFFQGHGIAFTAYDQNPMAGGGDIALESTFAPDGSEVVVHSPGLLHSPWLNRARELGCLCLGELDLAQLFLSNPTIAVTGTAGKTSTVTMLSAVLGHAGQRHSLTGNLGRALTSAIGELGADPGRWNLCEVSSFQANGLQYFSPDHVLWTNFGENHGDVHPTPEDYFLSKWRLLELCRGAAFVGEGIPDQARRFGRVLPHPVRVCPRWEGARHCDALALAHQRENFSLVRALALAIGLDGPAIGAALEEFCPPPYRLFRPTVVGNLELWNDSKATSSLAVRRALEHVARPGSQLLWISCGSPKGESWENFLPIVRAVDRVLCFGGVGERIAELAGPQKATLLADGEELFPLLRSLARGPGSCGPAVALFSPGFASFDSFAGYAERGRWFDGGVARLLE
ncbi:MAG: hypothetical protein LBT98_02780 [Puniceicoccales bacterium]|jgi:UDP-N-acetylmuramoylalanine--D-glutamate ligase|nr:hypothetical protein [Puniceicoccales bacterium]